MSKPIPLLIEIEETLFIAVLRQLHGLPGVAKVHFDIDSLGKKALRKNSNGAAEPVQRLQGPRAQDIIIAELMDGPKNLQHLRAKLAEHGFSPQHSANTALGELRKKDITESAGTGLHKLTETALAHLQKHQPDAAPAALPAPGKKPRRTGMITGVQAVINHLAAHNGAAARKALTQAIVDAGGAARSIDGAVGKLKAQKIIKATEPGIYEFTAEGRRKYLQQGK